MKNIFYIILMFLILMGAIELVDTYFENINEEYDIGPMLPPIQKK